MEKAIEYAKAIESWEDLVDPRTLAFYCLGSDPSAYVLRLIKIEGKMSKSWVRQYCIRLKEKILFFLFFFDKCFLLAEMTTKFNKDMYARMRGKKDEPLFALRTKSV